MLIKSKNVKKRSVRSFFFFHCVFFFFLDCLSDWLTDWQNCLHNFFSLEVWNFAFFRFFLSLIAKRNDILYFVRKGLIYTTQMSYFSQTVGERDVSDKLIVRANHTTRNENLPKSNFSWHEYTFELSKPFNISRQGFSEAYLNHSRN